MQDVLYPLCFLYFFNLFRVCENEYGPCGSDLMVKYDCESTVSEEMTKLCPSGSYFRAHVECACLCSFSN